jgi:uncharacterized RDD family membrane protein YckC
VLVCQYCRANNDEESHRCTRCGRRVDDDSRSRRPDMFPVSRGAAAPALEAPALAAPVLDDASTAPIQAAGPQLVTELPKPSERNDYAVQASLFGPQEVVKKVAPPRKQPVASPSRPKRERPSQHALDFNALSAGGVPTLSASVGPMVYADAPVAVPAHRAVAAALDNSLVLIAIGVFLATLYFAGHEIVLTKVTVPLYVAGALLISLFYRVFFCIAESDTLGMHWTGLRLLNFDGRCPSRKERVNRVLGTCVSIIALGIGFAWTLVDEDQLSWHDHISKTFPSPRDF